MTTENKKPTSEASNAELTVRDDVALRIMCSIFPRILDATNRYHGDRLKKEYFSQVDSAYQLADLFLEFRQSQNDED